MEIIINGFKSNLELTNTGLYKLSIPATGMFITERSRSLSENDLEIALNKIVYRAFSLSKHWDE